MDIKTIKRTLDNIETVLIKEIKNVKDISLTQGKTGMLLFLFIYAKYTNSEKIEDTALDLIDDISENIDKDTSLGYFNGIIGFGATLEYLVKNNFIAIDTKEYLEDVDSLIEKNIPYYPNIRIKEIAGYGKYLISRLNNRSNLVDREYMSRNRNSISEIVNSLERHYDYHDEIIGVIDLMTDVIGLDINAEKAKNYLDYAIDKAETMVYEDTHFNVYPATFNPLDMAMALIRTSEKFKNPDYLERALSFLNKYELDFPKYLSMDIDGLSSGGFKWSVIYNYLGNKLRNDNYLSLSEEWLSYSLKKYDEIIIREYQPRASLEMWNGYSQIGLGLLYILGECPENIFDMLPLYYL